MNYNIFKYVGMVFICFCIITIFIKSLDFIATGELGKGLLFIAITAISSLTLMALADFLNKKDE